MSSCFLGLTGCAINLTTHLMGKTDTPLYYVSSSFTMKLFWKIKLNLPSISISLIRNEDCQHAEITLSYIITCTDNRCCLLYVSDIRTIFYAFVISTWERRCHHALSCMLKMCSWVYIIPVDGMVKHQSGKSAYLLSFILILIISCYTNESKQFYRYPTILP